MSTKQQTFSDIDDGKDECPACGQRYERIGQHWYGSPSHRPKFTDRQKDIIIGMMLGDGSRLRMDERNNAFESKMTRKPFLEWLSNQFGVLGKDVFEYHSNPQERAKHHRDSGFYENANADDYHQQYVFRTTKHPFLNDFLDRWYTNNGIRFPNDIELTPTILKMWYVSDGTVRYSDGNFNGISIANINQIHRSDYFIELLKDIDFNISVTDKGIRFPKSQTDHFFEYVGDPVPGFKYKWATDDWNKYSRLKEEGYG